MPFQEIGKIIEKEELTKDHFKLTIHSRYIGASALPGQFVMVKCSNGTFPLLRRPLSFHSIDKQLKIIELLFKVVGPGTSELSKKKIGEEIDLLGPLGNGFRLETLPEVAILVGGGYGIAPMFALAEALKEKVKVIYALIGAKEKEYVLCENEFKGLGCEVLLTTEDGSYGRRGMVIDAVLELVSSKLSPELTQIYACGPYEMLKQIANISLEYKIRAQVSVEEKMACGVGACLGCPIKTKSGYKMVCKDGPIFDVNDIIWK